MNLPEPGLLRHSPSRLRTRPITLGPAGSRAVLFAIVLFAIVLFATSCSGDKKPSPPLFPDEGDPAPIRLFEENRLSYILSNEGMWITDPWGPVSFEGAMVFFDYGLWIGANVNGLERVSALSYFSSEVQPLPISADSVAQVYLVTVHTAQGDPDYDLWPRAAGAPVDPFDRPLLLGDRTAWTAHDDLDPARHTLFASLPLGAQIRRTIWAYHQPDSVLFERFEIRNVSNQAWSGTYLGLWCDTDVGLVNNDRIACDPDLDLGYAWTDPETPESAWGTRQPAVGVLLLETPNDLRLTAFPRILKNTTEPQSSLEAYRLLRGVNVDGAPFTDPTTEEATSFCLAGDPVTGEGWVDAGDYDRRMMLCTGPFDLPPAASVSLTVAIILSMHRDPLAAITGLRAAAGTVRANPAWWDHFAR